ncbi:MAG: nucleotide exchange factor GrpE [Chloroflexota bacterium]
MTDETTTEAGTRDAEDQAPQQEEDRFEVKWQKKASSSAAPAAEVPETDVTQLRKELDEERERTKNLQERWQRSAADLANLRRRTEQERGELEQLASLVLVQELLPVLDNFQRALATIPGNLSMLTWLQGIMLIERHFKAILERQGLEPIEAKGKPFNPAQHEAVTEKETGEAEPGTVLQEYQTGYFMHGRVIRPALVEVAAAPAPEPPAEATDDEQAEVIAEEAETENTGP